MNNNSHKPVLEWDRIPNEVQRGIDALKDKKVEDIRVYDLRGFTPFCDFVILGTAFSSAQARVAMAEVSDAMDSAGIKVYGVEGDENANWLLIDFWDVVVHLFRPENRHQDCRMSP